VAVGKTMSWITHLEELRRVIIVSVIALLVATIGCFFYSDYLLTWLQRPIATMDIKLVFIGVAEGFFAKIKIALYAGFVLSFPIITWQIWKFVLPALYPHERRHIIVLVPVSVLLFAGGVIFAFYTVLPIAIAFLLTVAGDLEPMISINHYLSFCMSFLIPFGIVFEMPVVAMFLTRIGVITPQLMASKRKYALLIMFIVGAVLTPGPDPVSQLLMAVPMYILYEVSIIVSRFIKAKKKNPEVEKEIDIKIDNENEKTD
jgi:sec-independent protein translocase protein TatC